MLIAIADEGRGHLEPMGQDVTHSHLHIVGNPLHEVLAVLALDSQHLLVHILHEHVMRSWETVDMVR